ncbi:hypothetical protein [Treponema sp. J25]|uniref:hypothetical protein n=1 Tax=Treponema sp. J25 TaxID=2094121 RepID=UPI00104C68D2|nr:hypothetical protein [Treponema sp. J25]
MVSSVAEDTSMKRYTEGERRALLAELGTSGKSLREFCEARGLNQRTVQRWQREAQQRKRIQKRIRKRAFPILFTGFQRSKKHTEDQG